MVMFVLIDKEKGFTSHDVVNILRKKTGIKKIGHAGTLDPNATGLLIVAIGKDSTKQISKYVGLTKEYEAEIHFGEEKDTDDVKGKTVKKKKKDKQAPTKKEIKKELKKFVGSISQTPPVYSSVKVGGSEAYKHARKGKSVKIKPRTVTIYSIKLIKYDYPTLILRLKVSSGTYVRSIARDLGRELGVYGYLENLRRTKVGKYKVKKAVLLKDLEKDNLKGHTI